MPAPGSRYAELYLKPFAVEQLRESGRLRLCVAVYRHVSLRVRDSRGKLHAGSALALQVVKYTSYVLLKRVG